MRSLAVLYLCHPSYWLTQLLDLVRDAVSHAIRKRAYAPHYTPANLALYQPEIHEFTNDCMDKIRLYDGQKPFDCLVLFRRLLTDIIFISSYGSRIQSIKQWDVINNTADPSSGIVTAINLFPVSLSVSRIVPQASLTFTL